MPEESTKVGRPQLEGKNRVEAVVVSWTGNAMSPVSGPTGALREVKMEKDDEEPSQPVVDLSSAGQDEAPPIDQACRRGCNSVRNTGNTTRTDLSMWLTDS